MFCTFMCTHECLVYTYTSINQMQTFYVGCLCDNIGVVLACLLSGTTGVTGSPSCYMAQPSGIPILLAIPIFPLFKFEEFLIYLRLFSNMMSCPAHCTCMLYISIDRVSQTVYLVHTTTTAWIIGAILEYSELY